MISKPGRINCILLAVISLKHAPLAVDIDRPSLFPSTPPFCHSALLGWRCVSWPFSASRRASVSTPEKTKPRHPDGSPRSDRLHVELRPTPNVMIRVWPSGCVCHAVRAPGSNVTLAAAVRAGRFG